ncbi:hypothetical protein B5G52_04125 [Pseudoalteromonas sp. A601]|uniref:hypothetical protein n=1 Tax=Pseudoalteromonas sp. A601 TaxID=1967839 RepID=UPI000B3C3517|nr:hypothetical protein [Pseudoalteromonas sp. A601]OUS73440.1 hypothetical protein B5G52_04125 [Pseudoalteromonas sp. A601]
MFNLFNNTKAITNIQDLMNLKQYKDFENIKQNGDLLYKLYEHTFDVYNRKSKTLQASVSYLYLQFKHLYGSLEKASLIYSHTVTDDFIRVFITEDEQWSIEIDEILQTICFYPNLSGFLNDKSKEEISMLIEDLSEHDIAFVNSIM